MTDDIEARRIYCPDCDEDYSLAFADDEDVYVVCGCDEAETATDFLERFRESHVDSRDTDIKGYQ